MVVLAQLLKLRSKVADLSRKLIATEDELLAAQQKLDAVRETATNWADCDSPISQAYGDEILKDLGASTATSNALAKIDAEIVDACKTPTSKLSGETTND